MAGATSNNKSSSISSAAAAARTMSTLVEDDGDDESPHRPLPEEDAEGEEGEEDEVETQVCAVHYLLSSRISRKRLSDVVGEQFVSRGIETRKQCENVGTLLAVSLF